MTVMDDAAFVELAQAIAPTLHRTAWVLTSDQQASEDLVQETLATMYAVLRRRRPVDSPGAYARSVLVRLFLDAKRRRSSSELVTDRVPDVPADDRGDTEGALALRAALAGLSASDRTVLVLRYLCDLTPAEVAHDLGITEGAVRTRASRAAARVRSVLGDDFLIETGDHDDA